MAAAANQPRRGDASENSADVIVVGGGAAGLFAAIEAADAGASVLLLESEPELGGSTRLSGGYAAFCETDLQPGTKEELFEDLAHAHNHDANVSLSRAYVDHSAETYDRLKTFGLAFSRVETFAHMSKPWAHELPKGALGGGAQIAAALERGARDRKVDIRASTRVRRLQRSEKGRVDALIASTNGHDARFDANLAIVLASGGFTRNPELIKCFGRPGSERIIPLTGPGSRGDGLLMGMGLGAALSYIGVGVAPTAPADPVTGQPCLLIYAGGIMLNKKGRRFVDESIVYLDISWAGLAQPDGLMLQVYDRKIRDAYLTSMLGQVVFGGREYSADTLEELFAKVEQTEGVDAAAALAAVKRYNDDIASDGDAEFGRQHSLGKGGIGGDGGGLPRIENPPFYVAPTVAGTTHFNGGLKVNEKMQVIDVFGDPIDGLYAAGETIGGFHGSGYLSASFVGSALIFGRIAGKNAAAGVARRG